MKKFPLFLLTVMISALAFSQEAVKYRTEKVMGLVRGYDNKNSYKELPYMAGILIVITERKVTIYDAPKRVFDIYKVKIDTSDNSMEQLIADVVDNDGREFELRIITKNPYNGKASISVMKKGDYAERIYQAKKDE